MYYGLLAGTSKVSISLAWGCQNCGYLKSGPLRAEFFLLKLTKYSTSDSITFLNFWISLISKLSTVIDFSKGSNSYFRPCYWALAVILSFRRSLKRTSLISLISLIRSTYLFQWLFIYSFILWTAVWRCFDSASLKL